MKAVRAPPGAAPAGARTLRRNVRANLLGGGVYAAGLWLQTILFARLGGPAAVGAYAYALLNHHFQLGFWTVLPLGAILGAFFGILLGFPVLRLRGDYLAIVTLAFGEIIRLVLINWVSLTNGSFGIQTPRITFFGLPFTSPSGGTTFSSLL